MFLLIGLSGFLAGGSFAADAVFSKDGARVYLRPYMGASGLIEVDLDKKESRFINLRDAIHDNVENLAVSNSGFVLCSTKKSVWAFDPVKSRCAKVCDFTAGEIRCIAYDPKSEIILATTGEAEFALPKNGDVFMPIFNRRAYGVDYPVFTADGALFFEVRGDLWMGGIEREEDASLNRYGTIAGSRVAPLAALETSECNASSTGIHDVALTRNYVYARYSRIGGSGWGDFIRFMRPATDGKKGDSSAVPSSADYWSQAKAILGSVEKLGDCSGASYLCASPNQVFFLNHETGDQSRVMMIPNDGKPELVEIKGLAACLGWK